MGRPARCVQGVPAVLAGLVQVRGQEQSWARWTMRSHGRVGWPPHRELRRTGRWQQPAPEPAAERRCLRGEVDGPQLLAAAGGLLGVPEAKAVEHALRAAVSFTAPHRRERAPVLGCESLEMFAAYLVCAAGAVPAGSAMVVVAGWLSGVDPVGRLGRVRRALLEAAWFWRARLRGPADPAVPEVVEPFGQTFGLSLLAGGGGCR